MKCSSSDLRISSPCRARQISFENLQVYPVLQTVRYPLLLHLTDFFPLSIVFTVIWFIGNRFSRQFFTQLDPRATKIENWRSFRPTRRRWRSTRMRSTMSQRTWRWNSTPTTVWKERNSGRCPYGSVSPQPVMARRPTSRSLLSTARREINLWISRIHCSLRYRQVSSFFERFNTMVIVSLWYKQMLLFLWVFDWPVLYWKWKSEFHWNKKVSV